MCYWFARSQPLNRNYFVLWSVLTVQLLARGNAVGHWMSLGIASLGASIPQDAMCSSIPGLVNQQVEVCRQNPQSILCVQNGARRAIDQCQFQFRFERWNCSTNIDVQSYRNNRTESAHLAQKGTRERAFVDAVLSAGVVHAVTESCTAGNFSDCTCDKRFKGRSSRYGFEWGGCSDNIRYGVDFARKFVDASEVRKLLPSGRRPINSLVNLHNNDVGRFAVLKKMRVKCRCHGVSGSCAVKTCWRAMPSFLEVGEHLKRMYANPVAVAPRSRKRLRRRDRNRRKIPITNDELVFVKRSPNYCRPDPKRSIPGTTGRVCKRSSSGPDSCNLLCCGRGYNTQIVKRVERCSCKFHWCCHVTCKKCEKLTEVFTCK